MAQSSLADKVVLVTSTMYDLNKASDRTRSVIALESIAEAYRRGYEMIIYDSDSPRHLLQMFSEAGARVIASTSKTMGGKRREAIADALKTEKPVIAYFEPEKTSYVPEIEKTAIPILAGEADATIARRRSLKSYPLFQQQAELLGNMFWERITGHELDMWFGPRTFSREAAHYFLDYQGAYGDRWEALAIPILDMIAGGKRIQSVLVEYSNPSQQTQIEEHDILFDMKRIEQLHTMAVAIKEHWGRIRKDKGS